MDSYYNQSHARAQLEAIIEERGQNAPGRVQLRMYEQEDGAGTTASPIYLEMSKCWKMSQPIDEDSNREEMVLRLQGILCKKDLPPLKKPIKINCKYIKQSVTLTSLGSQSMNDLVASAIAIHHTFYRTLPENSMENWTPSTFDNYPAIDIGNRYFSDRRDILSSEAIAFKMSVDPDGILEAATVDTLYAHTMENDVQYFELTADEEGNKKYCTIDPTKFRIGDIVEAQVSFTSVPLKEKKYKMIIVLRALTILDSTIVKNAERARYYERLQKVPEKLSLKRKVGYYEEEEETQRKMGKMAIDDNVDK